MNLGATGSLITNSEFRETAVENDSFESPAVAAQLNTGFSVRLPTTCVSVSLRMKLSIWLRILNRTLSAQPHMSLFTAGRAKQTKYKKEDYIK